MKDLVFLGDSRDRLRDFPEEARRTAGFQLRRVQQSLEPDNWKPMATVGPGVRVRESGGAFRVIYVALVADAVHVLHAFQKKGQKTPKLDLAARRLRALTAQGSP